MLTDNFAKFTDVGSLIDSGFGPTSFSEVGHSHVLGNVDGAQVALNGKSNRIHLNSFDEIYATVDRRTSVDTGAGFTLLEALAEKSGIGHKHNINDVLGLQAELNNRAFTMHTHMIADINGLRAELDGKVSAAHKHTALDIEDFQDAVAADVVQLLCAGNGIMLGYGAAGKFIISATPQDLNSYLRVTGGTLGGALIGTSITAIDGFSTTNFSINPSGSITAFASEGSNGQVLTSAGPGAPAKWSDAHIPPAVGAVSLFSASIIIEAAPTTITNIDLKTALEWNFTVSPIEKFTLNMRGSSTETLDSVMCIGQTAVLNVQIINSEAAHCPVAYMIDGVPATVKWSAATPIQNTNTINQHTLKIIKTAAATFIVLATLTRFS